MAKTKLKKGDNVRVIAGADKGKTGTILDVDRESNRARVTGVNVVKRHMKKGRSTTAPEGGILEKEAPVHLSNLMLVDAKSGEPTRVGYRQLDDGSKVRIAKKSDEIVE